MGVWLCCKPTLIETTSGGLACQTSGGRVRAGVWFYFPTCRSNVNEWENILGFLSRYLCVFTTPFHWLDLLAFSCNRVKQMCISPHTVPAQSMFWAGVVTRVKSPDERYWDLEGLVDLCCRFHSLVSLTYLWMYRRGRTSLAKERDMKIQLFVIYNPKIYIGYHVHGMGRLIHINQGIQIYTNILHNVVFFIESFPFVISYSEWFHKPFNLSLLQWHSLWECVFLWFMIMWPQATYLQSSCIC